MADNEAQLFGSIELSPIATVITDPRKPDNPIVAVNTAFEALTGYERADLIGRNCRFLAGAETPCTSSALLRHAVETGSSALVELVNYRKNGSRFRNAVMIAPLLDEGGELAYFLGSQMDVSGRTSGQASKMARDRVAALTKRQQAVLRLMARGMRNRQIADELRLHDKTVKMHRAALLKRLGAATSSDAIRLAVEAGL